MAATVRSPRSFHYDLSGRDKDFGYFRIPDPIVAACGIAPSRTKRRVAVALSTGVRMSGFATITSGWEVSFARHLQPELRRAAWFMCEVVGDDTADRADLRIIPAP